MFLANIRKVLKFLNENIVISSKCIKHVIVMRCFNVSVKIYPTALKLLNVVILFELLF